MSISILGAIVYDEIITHDKKRIDSYGGIIYNLAALSSLAGDECELYPFSNVGADHYDAVMELIEPMPGVRTDGIRKWDGKLTHAKLIYTDANYREEIVLNMMRPFTVAELEPALDCDAMLVNFVNGTELDLDTLKRLRGRTDAVMYLDVHNAMVRFRESDGKKEFREFSEWPQWVSQFDIVQMNEFECEKVLNVSPKDPYEFLDAAHHVLRAGAATAVLITMGPEGVALAHRYEGVELGCVVPRAPVEAFADATGCGDAFSAGVLLNYLKTGKPVVSAMAGSIVGAANCEVSGIGSLESARDAVDRIEEVSPELAEKARNGWLGLPLQKTW